MKNVEVIRMLKACTGEKRKKLLEKLQQSGEDYNIYPLANEQKKMLFLQEYLEDPCIYNCCFRIDVTSKQELELLEIALKKLVERHEILRTLYFSIDGIYFQAICKIGEYEIQSDEEDLSEEYADDREEYLEIIQSMINIPFDFACELPIRLLKIKQADNQFAMIITIHHIAADGWSIGILQEELNEVYMSLVNKQECVLKKMEYKYVDYAVWQKSASYKELIDEKFSFWKEYLKHANNKLNLPIEFQVDKNQNLNCGYVHEVVSKDLAEKMQNWVKEHNISMFNLMLSVYYMTLHEFTGDDNINIGTVAANRNRWEFKDVFGYFANTVFINDVRNEMISFEKYAIAVEENAYKVFENQEAPFDMIVSEFRKRRNTSDASLFQIMFSVQNEALIHKGSNVSKEEKIQIEQFGQQQAIQYPIIATIIDRNDEIQLFFSYHANKFSERRIKALLKGMEELLEQIMENDQRMLSEYHSTIIQKELETYGCISEVKEEDEIVEHDNVVPDICEKVIEIWKDITGNTKIGENDKFFQIGGNSMNAITVMERMNETFDANIKIEDLFRYTTVKALAGFINQKTNNVSNEVNADNTIFEEF